MLFLFFVLVSIIVQISVSPGPLTTSTYGELWPLPQQIVYHGFNRSLCEYNDIVFEPLNLENCQILQDVYIYYKNKNRFFPYENLYTNNGTISALKINVNIGKSCPDESVFPQQGMNETYTLEVPIDGNILIEADEIWGVIRAIESLSQLIFFQDDCYYIRSAAILDYPRFLVRGFLLDTSRHFIAPEIIIRQIDLAAQNKLNLFHWHIVDNEAFPYVSTAFPNLSIGAFSPRHRYSTTDISKILKFARMLGVRVMIDFDTPGHVGAWKGQTGFLAKCQNESVSSIMNPTRDENYTFLIEFFKEVVSVFPENFIFLGGDKSNDLYDSCWKFDPEIRIYMKKYNINVTALKALHISKLSKIFNEIAPQKTRLYWQDSFTLYNPDDKAIVAISTLHTDKQWQQIMKNIAQKGHKMVLYSCWYLNDSNNHNDWLEASKDGCDPSNFDATDEEKALILGGIASLTGEHIDGTNLEDRLWPQASVVAERFWSPKDAALNRENTRSGLHEHRCRMVGRGFRAQPINGPSFCPVEIDTHL